MFNRSQNNGADTTTYAPLSDLEDLKDRVARLEGLARQLTSERGGLSALAEPRGGVGQYDRSGLPAAARGEETPAGRTATPRVSTTNVTGGTTTRVGTGVDYGAIAFGLSEIRRKLAGVLDGPTLRSEHEGAVQYFADVFSKADPAFNEAEFKRQAGA